MEVSNVIRPTLEVSLFKNSKNYRFKKRIGIFQHLNDTTRNVS